VTAVSQAEPTDQSIATRRRGTRSQRTLVELIANGDATGAEKHWRAHMAVVGKVLLGQQATTIVDLLDHY
jgi:GntR family transcriptional repressor for pyruvate dehydrogenase complex